MTQRALIAATLALLGVPSFAHAATRPVQAFDQGGSFSPVWTPNQLTAQPGDTIRWQFEQPGNANAGGTNHDLFLVRPGVADERLGASYSSPAIEATLDQAGTYGFYCSIHRDSMFGEITVTAGPETPVVDPGRPWESPAPPIVVDNGPPALLNAAAPLTVFEAGDTIAPTLRLMKVTTVRRVARARVEVSEPGTLYARVLRGSKAITTVHVNVAAGASTVKVKLPKRRAHYRLAVWVRDGARLESKWRFSALPLK